MTLSTNTLAALIAAMILVRHGRFQPSKTVTVHDLRAAHAEHGVDVALDRGGEQRGAVVVFQRVRDDRVRPEPVHGANRSVAAPIP